MTFWNNMFHNHLVEKKSHFCNFIVLLVCLVVVFPFKLLVFQTEPKRASFLWPQLCNCLLLLFIVVVFSSIFFILSHRFLTGGPWQESRGSAKIKKVKYCTFLNLFYWYSGVRKYTVIIKLSVDFFDF